MKKFNLNPRKDSIPSELVEIGKENATESPSKLWLDGGCGSSTDSHAKLVFMRCTPNHNQ